jgi:endonuclease YncB( thermonuclease family)
MIWNCPAVVDHVHDGDTVICSIDLGWHISVLSAVRVDGLAAPELSTQTGKAARDFALQLLPPGIGVTIVSKKLLGTTEKYGRVLADVLIPPGKSFAEAMIEAGHGKPWDGTGKQPT